MSTRSSSKAGTSLITRAAAAIAVALAFVAPAWAQHKCPVRLTATDGAAIDRFGVSVSVSGDTAVVGAYQDDVGANGNQGSAWVYRGYGTWTGPDFNNSGTVTVQDLFDYLAAWFAASPSADFNGSGTVTVQDLFDFLAAFFAGCA